MNLLTVAKMGSFQAALVFLVALFGCVWTRPGGAPSTACSSLTPGHGAFSPQTTPGGYFLYSTVFDNVGVYTPGMTYTGKPLMKRNTSTKFTRFCPHTVILQRTDLQPFEGFIIQARNATALPAEQLIGTFVITDSTNSQLLTCSGNDVATVGLLKNYPVYQKYIIH